MPRFAVVSKYKELHGGYLEKGSNDGMPCYVKDISTGQKPACVFHESRFGDRKCWFFAVTPPQGKALSSYCSSKDDAKAPYLAQWNPDEVEHIRVIGDDVDRQTSETYADLFRDKEFPHTPASIGDTLQGVDHFSISWLPVRCLREGKWHLFDCIEPADLLQGSLGDCWLVAAMSALAEFPAAVKSLFGSADLEASGRYKIKLFDHRQDNFREVVIDEFVPCHPRHWWDLQGKPLFSRPNGNEAWVLLLEKAMAKMFGDYSKLDGGNAAVAFRALTGERGTFMWDRSDEVWRRWTLSPRDTKFQSKGRPEEKKDDALFRDMLQHDRANHLMSCSMRNATGPREFKRKDGLVEGHSYSLLQVIETERQRLLCLRNPWGNDQVWNGSWSDGSREWEEYPQLRERLRPDFSGDDGIFWMSWDDFFRVFDNIVVCPQSMRTGEAASAHAMASMKGFGDPILVSGKLPARPPKGPPVASMNLPKRPPRRLDCPGQHGLQQQPLRAQNICDLCGQRLKQVGAFGCRVCDFDVCAACVAKAAEVAQPPARPPLPAPATPPPAPPPAGAQETGELFPVGTSVEYFSESQRRWVPAQVLGINPDRTYRLTVHASAPPTRVRRAGGGDPGANGAAGGQRRPTEPVAPAVAPVAPFPPGAKVEYFSESQKRWFPAEVLGYDAASQTYTLNIKSGAPAARVRPAGGGKQGGDPKPVAAAAAQGPAVKFEPPPRRGTLLDACPKGHPLYPYQIDHKGYSCDNCHNRIPSGSMALSCRQCDFDACGTCTGRGGQPPPPAPPPEAVGAGIFRGLLGGDDDHEADYDSEIAKFDTLRRATSQVRGARLCANGCDRPAFGRYPTCCSHCKGASGPHARDCAAKGRRSTQ